MVATRVRLLPACFSLLVVVLCGCGTSSQSTSTSQVAPTNASTLAGNWLLAGAMPPGYYVTPTMLSVTSTFDVNGNSVSGIVQVAIPCVTTGALGSPVIVQGTVAADGSFTLNSVAVTGISQTVTITGRVPTASGASWAGMYTFTNAGTACAGTTSGSIAAVSVPSVTGTYSATASLGNPLNGSVQNAAVKVALVQGATLSSGTYSNLPLSGTITVSNACINSGISTGAPLAGFVEGAQVGINFLMNDGSTVLIDGQINSTTGASIPSLIITTNPGTCGLSFSTAGGPLNLMR